MQRNTVERHSLEGLLFDLKTWLSAKYLKTSDIRALASTSIASSTLFSSKNTLLWNMLLRRDFNVEIPDSKNAKEVYALLAERQRLVIYTQFLLNPIKEIAAPAKPKTLPQPWMIAFRNSDKSRYHAMALLRDQLMQNSHEGFLQTAQSYMQPMDPQFLAGQSKQLICLYKDIFLTKPHRSLQTVINYLTQIQNHEYEGNEIDRLSLTHQFIVMMSILSKCGAQRSLTILLNNLSINPAVLKMFYDRFGAELCIDAIHYHRPAMVGILLPTRRAPYENTQITPTNSFSDLMSEEAPVNYAAANCTASNIEYMEHTMLTPLGCALNSLRQFYFQISQAEAINNRHRKILSEFQQMISLLMQAHANPNMAIVELDLESRTHHISLSQNARDLAKSLLEEVQMDRRLDESIQAQLCNIVETVINAKAVVFKHEKYIEDWSDSSSDSSHDEAYASESPGLQRLDVHNNDDNEQQGTPTKQVKLSRLSLNSPR